MPMPAAMPGGHPPAYTPFQYPSVPPIDKTSFTNKAFPGGGAGFNIPPKTDMPMPPIPPNSDKELNVNYTVSRQKINLTSASHDYH